MNCCHLAVAIFALLPLQAHARETAPKAHVAYRDLDLRTPAGLQVLDRRLAAAIKTLCPSPRGSIDLGFQREARRCAALAEKQALAERDRVVAADLAANIAPVALTDRNR
jgi:UrcA family protein